ncbi:hypothetical protein M513_04737 [Trichuris suis]|uniref:SCP domain-containing protein n=1 Tax=Trichuris suis TaxID=68888 RepID=A0A085MAZ8_9BILA|nr:hypothetical protein M513_04737 [Trichuris suis]
MDSVDGGEKGVAVIYVATDSTSVDEYINQLNLMKQMYQYETNKCNSPDGTDTACKNYKQFVWWQGGKIGCSKAICRAPPSTTSTMMICYFEKKSVFYGINWFEEEEEFPPTFLRAVRTRLDLSLQQNGWIDR